MIAERLEIGIRTLHIRVGKKILHRAARSHGIGCKINAANARYAPHFAIVKDHAVRLIAQD